MKRIVSLLAAVSLHAWAQAHDAGVPTAVPAPAEPMPVMSVTEGLSTPESVLYDADSDTYLVSNISGDPSGKDNDGYITEVSPEGHVLSSKLVAGGASGATLNAPKGMALHGGVLYVADIDVVRMFDRKSGAPKGEVKVPGATFLNDLALGPDGRLYLTDSGFNPKFEGTGTDAVYAIELKKKPVLKKLVKAKSLNHPNGIVATKDTLYVVGFGAAEVQALDLKGKAKGKPDVLPKGQLDGVVLLGDELIVSSWEGSSLYRGKRGGAWREIAHKLEAPADLGYDSKRHRVLVPRFKENRVEAWPLE